MNQRLRITVIIFVVVVIGGLIWFSQVKAPALVRSKIESAVGESCPDCKIEIGSVKTPIFPLGDIVLKDLKFTKGEANSTLIEVSLEQLKVHVSKVNWGSNKPTRVVLRELIITSPSVTYTEGDGKAPQQPQQPQQPKQPKQESDEPAPIVIIEKTKLTDGRITYLRDTHGTHAVLKVHSVAIDVGVIDTDPAKVDEWIEAQTVAQIEKSGTVDLGLKIAPFADKLKMDVEFRVRDQNLSDLNTFLKPNAGVNLRGILKRGRSRIIARDREAKVRVWAEYHGLGLDLHKTHDTSELEAFFVEMGAELTMEDKNLEKSEDDKIRTTTYTRKPGQGIVGFLVQGMKEAAIKVAQAK